MIMWITPIIDRTENDVKKAIDFNSMVWDSMTDSQKTEYLNYLKGALNTTDIDRIINNIKLLDEVLETHLTIPVKPYMIPDNNFFSGIRTCVEAIRSAYAVHVTTPDTPNLPFNDYEKINHIEQILLDIYEILNTNFFYYSGTGLTCGNDIGLLE